jgi:hypothetical protein
VYEVSTRTFRQEVSENPVDRVQSRSKAGVVQEYVTLLPHVIGVVESIVSMDKI